MERSRGRGGTVLGRMARDGLSEEVTFELRPNEGSQ